MANNNENPVKVRIMCSDTLPNFIDNNSVQFPISLIPEDYEWDLDIIIPNVNGSQLDPFYIDDVPERRNGIPSDSYNLTYDGSIHIYPIDNFTPENLTLQTNIEKIRLFEYKYLTFWYLNDSDEPQRYLDAEIIEKINPNVTATRFTVRTLSIIHNNSGDPNDANKEYDLDYSLYNIWNSTGLVSKITEIPTSTNPDS